MNITNVTTIVGAASGLVVPAVLLLTEAAFWCSGDKDCVGRQLSHAYSLENSHVDRLFAAHFSTALVGAAVGNLTGKALPLIGRTGIALGGALGNLAGKAVRAANITNVSTTAGTSVGLVVPALAIALVAGVWCGGDKDCADRLVSNTYSLENPKVVQLCALHFSSAVVGGTVGNVTGKALSLVGRTGIALGGALGNLAGKAVRAVRASL